MHVSATSMPAILKIKSLFFPASLAIVVLITVIMCIIICMFAGGLNGMVMLFTGSQVLQWIMVALLQENWLVTFHSILAACSRWHICRDLIPTVCVFTVGTKLVNLKGVVRISAIYVRLWWWSSVPFKVVCVFMFCVVWRSTKRPLGMSFPCWSLDPQNCGYSGIP